MAALVSVVGDNGSVLFEADASPEKSQQLQETGLVDDVLQGVHAQMQDVMSTIHFLVDQLSISVRAQAAVAGPTKTELEIGIKVDAEGRVFVAKAAVGANITLRLTWESEPGPRPVDGGNTRP